MWRTSTLDFHMQLYIITINLSPKTLLDYIQINSALNNILHYIILSISTNSFILMYIIIHFVPIYYYYYYYIMNNSLNHAIKLLTNTNIL